MERLLMSIGLGGVIAAAGALIGGIAVVGLRMLINKQSRARQRETIRQIGLTGAAKQALFDLREPELEYKHRRAAS